MVPVAELELDDVADGGRHHIGYIGILWSAHHHRNDLVGTLGFRRNVAADCWAISVDCL